MNLDRRSFLNQLALSSASVGLSSLLGGCGAEGKDSAVSVELPKDPKGRWWLSGNYAPVQDELVTTSLRVEGAIPSELVGTFFRNGANPKNAESLHWFTGDGMLHAVRFEAGRAAWYRNKFVATRALRDGTSDNLAANRANTSIRPHAGKLLALYEVGVPHAINPKDLSTIGEYDFDGKLVRPMTAHPKVDPKTGELFSIGYAPFAPYLTYHRIDATGRHAAMVEVAMNHSSMMHDFQITQNWAVLFDLPVHFDTALLAAGFPFRWAPEAGARFGLLKRDGTSSEVRWFEVPPCFMFHSFNAYETAKGTVVLEGCRLSSLWAKGLADASEAPTPWRWELDPATGRVAEGKLYEGFADFPQIDSRRAGLEHRVAYALQFDGSRESGVVAPTGIAKFDRAGGNVTAWRAPAGHQPDEALFVPKGPGEDEGYLLSMVYDASIRSSYVAILDASNLVRGPLAKVFMPRRVPFGFHGAWLEGA